MNHTQPLRWSVDNDTIERGREEPPAPASTSELVGDSPALAAVKQQLCAVASADSTVLLCGETGTGKEVLARVLHGSSPRRAGPFVKINCAAIPAGLLESELMGHEKGAFTGAVQRRIGRFEQAHDGTIFLDEIGELALDLQPKLLRLLQEREFERVGGSRTMSSNARVIAATNRDLSEMVRARAFREDLFYRLSVFPIRVPPLRERREDIPALAAHFVKVLAARAGRVPVPLSPQTMEQLLRYDWPGNIRELQNVLERAIILGDGELQLAGTAQPPARMPAPARLAHDPGAFICDQLRVATKDLYAATHEHLDRLLLELVLQHSRGNLRNAARTLGISRQTLRTKLRALEIRVERTVCNSARFDGPTAAP